jgi:hypothetical protein
MEHDLQTCLRCGSDRIKLEEWYCGDSPKPLFRYGCESGHWWDEWCDTEEEARIAWNEYSPFISRFK